MAVLSILTYLRGIYKLNLSAASKVHNAIIQSIYDCFIMARDDLTAMRLEMCLSTATGHWLDCWGEFFSVYRKSGETDKSYSKRIIYEVTQPKSTIPAVKDGIINYLNSKYNKSYTREDIIVKEPWKEIAKYSHKGTLSNTARFFSGDYYCHAIMDISIPEQITDDLIDLINSIKAAGVKILWSILNQYDIVSGFNEADDAWAAYSRHIQSMTKRNQFSGLVLSNSSPKPVLSGNRETWFWMNTYYEWYANIGDKDTDQSVILTKKDLIGLLDYYTEIEETVIKDYTDNLSISDSGGLSTDKLMSGSEYETQVTENLIKITDNMLASLELMDHFLCCSYQGRMSTSSGVMFKHLAQHDLFVKLMEELKKFKEEHPDYYNSVQPPILNGERVMWLVERNKNWLWNTPTMTHQDFFELWEPFGEAEEHTINSIIEFEDAYYKGYITFGDKYQPPIVVGDKFRWTPILYHSWLWESPVYLIEDLPGVYRRQFNYALGQVDHPDPTIEDIELLEERFTAEGYSIAKDTQPVIEITSSPITSTET